VVHRGPVSPVVHRAMDWVHDHFLSENNLKIQYSRYFSFRPLPFPIINPQSTQLHKAPWMFKNNYRYTPSHFQKLQIGPYNVFSPYLWNHNSKFSDSFAKILRITSSFFLCIHITLVCFILLIDCLCLLHDR
jgi:hypothetical protein